MTRLPTTSNPWQAAHEPLYDVNPATGVSIEVFYADRTLETFGRGGAGWFWWAAPTRLCTGGLAHRAIRYAVLGLSARHDRTPKVAQSLI